MAGDLMARCVRSLRRAAAATALSAGALLPAHALGPQAPFAPPAATSAAATSPIATEPEPTGLTGVRLGTPPQALIDGRWHRLGEPVRGARLSAVNRRGATLRHPDGRRELLWLLPPALEPERGPR
ncbi:MAG: hypothetical protein HS106_10915 [Ideonella sp.]|nr:hypothetical protein [Ideonella sp.]